jgi:hypothetical protein
MKSSIPILSGLVFGHASINRDGDVVNTPRGARKRVFSRVFHRVLISEGMRKAEGCKQRAKGQAYWILRVKGFAGSQKLVAGRFPSSLPRHSSAAGRTLLHVSRAFMKEDSAAPEQKRGAYRVYLGRSRYDFDPVPVDSSDDFLEALRLARSRQGYVQLRDASGELLLELI